MIGNRVVPTTRRLAITAATLLGAVAFALDTWRQGWAPPELAVGTLAVLAAGAATLGRAACLPIAKRAAPRLAGAALAAALALLVFHRYI
jgi:hypothetical protein